MFGVRRSDVLANDCEDEPLDDSADSAESCQHDSEPTTHLEFEPLELIGRLAAFVPRPRTNLTLYHGVLAPNARLRAEVVAYGRDAASTAVPSPSNAAQDAAPKVPAARGLWTWANLMRRAFAIDVLACTTCGGRLELVSVITCPATAASIAAHLRRRRYPPRASPRWSGC